MTAPKAVIACAWYNRADMIHDTVESLLAQDYDDFEIVIVNDGSTDPRVREILDSYTNPRLRVIHQANAGFVAAITRAINASQAPYILIQGSGDISYPDRVRKQVELLQSRPDVAAVGSLLDNILDAKTGRQKVYGIPIDADVSRLALRQIIMMHGEAAYRRDLFDKVGGYRPFFRFSQDRDLWCRLSREGKIVVLDDILYRRFANVGGVSGDPEKQLVQRYLSHFAVYCHDRVMRGMSDPLERFGEQAGLLFQGNWALQKDLVRLSLRYFLANAPEAAAEILDQARTMKWGAIARLTAWSLHAFPRLMESALRKIRND